MEWNSRKCVYTAFIFVAVVADDGVFFSSVEFGGLALADGVLYSVRCCRRLVYPKILWFSTTFCFFFCFRNALQTTNDGSIRFTSNTSRKFHFHHSADWQFVAVRRRRVVAVVVVDGGCAAQFTGMLELTGCRVQDMYHPICKKSHNITLMSSNSSRNNSFTWLYRSGKLHKLHGTSKYILLIVIRRCAHHQHNMNVIYTIDQLPFVFGRAINNVRAHTWRCNLEKRDDLCMSGRRSNENVSELIGTARHDGRC